MQRAILRHKANKASKIPFGQKAVFYIISVKERTNIKEISQTLQITSGAATQHVEALVQDDLVVRKTDKSDRRGVIITLTKTGKSKAAELRRDQLTRVTGYFEDITDEQLNELIKILNKVNQNIEEERK